MARRSSTSLSEHARHLQEEQERVMREVAAMEKEMRKKPKVVRPSATPERRAQRLDAVTAIGLPRPRSHVFRGSERRGPVRRTPRRREVRIQQAKFAILCIVLLAIALFVWSNFPG